MNSIADDCGLCNSDVLLSINGKPATSMTHDEAHDAIVRAGHDLQLKIYRGPFDHLQQTGFEPITTTHDTDHTFQPSEVERDDRSSPFLTPTKPYRPFSTEPILEVPPIEDPIILNPDYHDEFPKYEFKEKIDTIFKLPISLQYVPEQPQININKCINKTNSDKIDKVEIKVESVDESLKRMTIEEMKFEKKMNEELDITKIEETAFSIVDESIAKAITVTEDMTKEINIALDENVTSIMTTESKSLQESSDVVTIQNSIESKSIVSSTNVVQESAETKESLKKISTNISLNDVSESKKQEISSELATADFISRKTEESMAIEQSLISNIKAIESKANTESKEIITQEKKEELNESQSNNTKSDSLIKTENIISSKCEEQNTIESKDISKVNSKDKATLESNINSTVADTTQQTRQSSSVKSSTTQHKEQKSNTGAKMSTSKLLAEQRSYVLGLQTIPNIKGRVHSSYHYDLLLKTFFIHLTDVMVALSRFILNDNVLSKSNSLENVSEVTESVSSVVQHDSKLISESENKSQNIVKQEVAVMETNTDNAINTQSLNLKTDTQYLEDQNKSQNIVKQEVVVMETNSDNSINTQGLNHKTDTQYLEDQNKERFAKQEIYENNDYKEVHTKKSGSKMAQLTSKKSEELIHHMDAVVSEFQSKTETDEVSMDTSESSAIVRARRSRSRSRIEEDVSKENDPLDWLSKNDTTQFNQDIRTDEMRKAEQVIVEAINTHEPELKKTITGLRETKAVQKSYTEHSSKLESSKSESVDGKTYIAIVEAHVYTNRDLIGKTGKMTERAESQVITDSETVVSQNTEIVKNDAVVETMKTNAVIDDVSKSDIKTETVEDIVTVKDAEIIKDISDQLTSAVSLSQETVQEAKELVVKNVEIKQNEQTIVSKKDDSKEILHEKFEHTLDVQNREIVQTSDVIETAYTVVCVQMEDKIEQSTEIIQESKQVNEEVKHEVISQAEDVNVEIALKSKSEQILQVFQDTKGVIIKESNQKTAEDTQDSLEVIQNSEGQILQEINKKVEATNIEISEITLEEAMAKSNIAIITCEPVAQDINEKVIVELTSENKDKRVHFDIETNTEHNLEEVEIMAAAYQTVQESSFTASLKTEETSAEEFKQLKTEAQRKLSLKLQPQRKFESQWSDLSKTPTPSTVPPTPLTDEYVFRLALPLVESTIPHEKDPSPTPPSEHEDPNIVKKKLIPHIETTIESIVYDQPLASPASNANTPPAFTQHGLADGITSEEEILEIERKSSLLASAIDQTIKSIEEYKEQVGIENVVSTAAPALQNGYSNTTNGFNGYSETINNVEESKIKFKASNEANTFIDKEVNCYESTEDYKSEKTEMEQDWANVSQQVTANTDNLAKLTQNYSYNAAANSTLLATESLAKVAQNLSYNTTEPQNVVDNLANMTQSLYSTNHLANTTQNLSLNTTETQNVVENLANMTQSLYQPTNNVQFVENLTNVSNTMSKQNLVTEFSKEIGGTNEGIMNTMEGATVIDNEIAKEIGKPGLTDDKIAELISGEAEMLREAHVMGLKRVLSSHMMRPDDSSVDFKKIKPIIENLKDSEVLRALNDEVMKTHEEKKKEERKWTKFLQRPNRPVPKNKLGYLFRYTQPDEDDEEPYKVKIVKQPKPKVAPDYKEEENFETGPLPWEERAANEPPPPPIPRQDPILIPEEKPEYLEAVDPLPESEVPDLEDTGIPLPPEKKELPPAPIKEEIPAEVTQEVTEEVKEEPEREESVEVVEREEMDQNRMAEDIMGTIQNMVDPNATLEQQLMQMRSQLAALAQLPGVIQQTLEMVTKQLTCMTSQEVCQTVSKQEHTSTVESSELVEVTEKKVESSELVECTDSSVQITDVTDSDCHEAQVEIVSEAIQKLKEDEAMMLAEQKRVEKERKELEKLDQESRQLKQRPTPRPGKPKPVFGPLTPQERPLVLPGGRKWRTPKDAYNEEFIAETLTAQAELIQGKAKGINFMKYEKPPVSLDHLKDSDVYKLIHSLDEGPVRRVEMLTPVVAECDYREKCRSVTPCGERMPQGDPQQMHP